MVTARGWPSRRISRGLLPPRNPRRASPRRRPTGAAPRARPGVRRRRALAAPAGRRHGPLRGPAPQFEGVPGGVVEHPDVRVARRLQRGGAVGRPDPPVPRKGALLPSASRVMWAHSSNSPFQLFRQPSRTPLKVEMKVMPRDGLWSRPRSSGIGEDDLGVEDHFLVGLQVLVAVDPDAAGVIAAPDHAAGAGWSRPEGPRRC